MVSGGFTGVACECGVPSVCCLFPSAGGCEDVWEVTAQQLRLMTNEIFEMHSESEISQILILNSHWMSVVL